MKPTIYQFRGKTLLFGLLWILCMVVGTWKLLFTHLIDGALDLATVWYWLSLLCAVLLVWSRMAQGVRQAVYRVRLGERIATLEILRARVNLDVQQFETRWALADVEARKNCFEQRQKIHEASRNLMKQIKQAESKISRDSKPLGFMYSVKDFWDQAQELSAFIQRASFILRPQDTVGYGLDGAQPLNYPSELFAFENAFAPHAGRRNATVLFTRFVTALVCIALGGAVAMFFETLVLLNFDLAQLVDGLTRNGVFALLGIHTAPWDPSIPLAFLTGLLAGYLVYLRLLPWLEEKIRFGKLRSAPVGDLAILQSRIDDLLDKNGLFDASKITWIFDQRIVATMKAISYSPVEFLYQSSVAGAVSFYDQLLIAENKDSKEFASALGRLEAWTQALEGLAEPIQAVAKNQKSQKADEDSEENIDQYRTAEADELSERLLLLGF